MKELLSLLEGDGLEESAWPEAGDTIRKALEPGVWRNGGNAQDNAWIKPWGSDWNVLAQGYAVGALILANWVLKTHWFQDPLVYPVLFLFRHYLELRLKGLVELVRLLQRDERPAPSSHSLKEVVSELDRSLPEVPGWDPVDPAWEAVKTCVMDLQQMDPKGEVFRYHRNTRGEAIHVKHPQSPEGQATVSYVNLRALSSLMQKVSNFLDATRDWLEHDLESRERQWLDV